MSTVLVIEEEKVLRETITEILNLSNYEVILAKSGQEGVQKAKKNYPDLVLCDVIMSFMDGIETLSAFRSSPELKNIPFVFLSGMSKMSDFRKGMNLGAEDYLIKPFEPSELLNVIEAQLDKLNYKESKELVKLNRDKTVLKLQQQVDMMKLKWQSCIKSASQIQNLILPKQNEIEKLFPDHFNYYNPKY
ncbi:MAG: response regulator, partial [Flavobacteriales bacterium]|nr:response regulator [Flavobacteriales bacterium]